MTSSQSWSSFLQLYTESVNHVSNSRNYASVPAIPENKASLQKKGEGPTGTRSYKHIKTYSCGMLRPLCPSRSIFICCSGLDPALHGFNNHLQAWEHCIWQIENTENQDPKTSVFATSWILMVYHSCTMYFGTFPISFQLAKFL